MWEKSMGDSKHMIRVICCGNPFRGDDGVGLDVFKRLKKETFPRQVQIIEGGILGINLLPLFYGCDQVILVDSILMNETPGHLQWVTMADVLQNRPARISSHEINPVQLMTLWHQLNTDSAISNILLLGIVILEPKHLTDTISPEIQQSSLMAVNEIKNKIRSFITHEKG